MIWISNVQQHPMGALHQMHAFTGLGCKGPDLDMWLFLNFHDEDILVKTFYLSIYWVDDSKIIFVAADQIVLSHRSIWEREKKKQWFHCPQIHAFFQLFFWGCSLTHRVIRIPGCLARPWHCLQPHSSLATWHHLPSPFPYFFFSKRDLIKEKTGTESEK